MPWNGVPCQMSITSHCTSPTKLLYNLVFCVVCGYGGKGYVIVTVCSMWEPECTKESELSVVISSKYRYKFV